ncbi:TPA: sodium:proton exchanger [Candidatus Uhrbacteria bacterium]|uniref:Transporter, CPA2 family n=2 Tax=Candidatus Uhriibacteriota TaxID=1752732 RepID=A0A0G1Q5Z0_9BACT|nr:MAG: Transporter, CPA2 family [Candidatus Uhrbacteria bacterium GW2011_GWF2_46_218]KKU40476.1 MAG: Transporter, CPA2 family [Candidatus Uhrbacteria bacterium GW2011_GWE2_46_68]HBK34010.1 sodium:proton exchanger [Candidatus Uhrbacteria bacterium]HCB19741.1 sodium:proton exchanger [Candidatus Uhrbacteria bacterium]
MLLEELFFQIGFIVAVAGLLSLAASFLRQPLIMAYIIAGVIVGPSVLAVTHNTDVFQVMAELGVAFLLFTVGLGLNWRGVKDVGGISLATGVGQVLFTSVAGFAVGLLLGLDTLTSMYLAITFAFSSTIIVVKLLMDKEDLSTLYGRISIGFLLVQDFIAMFLLLVVGAFSSGATLEHIFVNSLLKGIVIIPVLWLVSTKIVPPLLSYVAKSQELLMVFALSWCFLVAGVLSFFGFGVEIGALLAGMSLSGSVYHREINARVRPLRDFFLIIFFVILGARLDLGSLGANWLPIFAFSVFVLISNPLVVLLLMRAFGYHPRTGFLTGTSIAQISEFSFIILAAGIAAGHISDQAMAIATPVALITIAISSYFIKHNEQVYIWIRPLLRWMEPDHMLEEEKLKERKASHVLLFGYHRMGAVLLPSIKKLRKSYTIVDFDPQAIRELTEVGEPVVYGDAGDEGFLQELQVQKSQLIISTIPDASVSLSLLAYVHRHHYTGTVIVSAHRPEEAERCYRAGATFVIVPSVLGGERFTQLLASQKTKRREWETWVESCGKRTGAHQRHRKTLQKREKTV